MGKPLYARGRRRRLLRQLRTAVCLPLASSNELAHVVDEYPPIDIGAVAAPVAKLGRMRQLENDRTIARLDDRRDERVASIGERRLGTNPARCNRPRGPQHDNRFRVPQPLLDHFVKGFAGVKRGVPPDVEAFLDQRLREDLGDGPVGASVGNENVSCGHARLPR